MSTPSFSPESFQTFGDLLKYLRRRARLTQLELSITVGYSEAQIGRLENNQRLPDLTAIKALFIPALHLEDEPELMKRFLGLVESARQEDAPTPGVAPYKGLLFFDEADADLFFGREALTTRLAQHVMDLAMDAPSRFLAVVGASGSGKSSLARAGLTVALKRAGWETRVFTPTVHPLRRLNSSLSSAHTKDAERILILVDQFEEVFTLCRDEMERIAFVEKLLAIAQEKSKKIIVVIALRADFYSHCAQYPLLRQAVATEQEYIGQMNAEELRRAIEEPARRGGWELEPGLVDVLLNDIGLKGTSEPEPGALPLLSHALLATWERRRGRTFTLDGYHASGGVRGAIAETAESVFNDQLNQTQQELARDVFLRLTELGEGTEDTRRRAALNELARQSAEATQLRGVLNTLAEARLITLNEDSAEVAHEALIREWQRLHEWLTQDRDGLLLHRRLTESAHEWEARERDPSELYRGARLAQVREWASTNEGRLNAGERSFLAASMDQEQRAALEHEAQRRRELEAAQKLAETEKARAEEQAFSIKQLRQRGAFLASALILALVAAILASVFARNAQQQALIASVRELASASNLNLEVDPELSILLALQAVDKTYSIDQTVLPEAVEALHRAVSAQQPYLSLHGHDSGVNDVAFSPDGKLVATASLDGTAKIWDSTTAKELLTLHPDTADAGKLYSVIFSPDGKQLATAGEAGALSLWDSTTGERLLVLNETGEPSPIYALSYSPDGARLATASRDGMVRVWELATAQVSLELSIDLTLPPDTFTIFNVHDVAFSPDGTRLATVGPDNTAKVWDAMTGEELLTLTGYQEAILALAYSPDGTRIATASYGATTKIWDAVTGAELLTLSGNVSRHTGVAFSPDGTRLAIVSDDGTAKVWDAFGGQQLFTLTGHISAIRSVAFSPDGTRIATASDDATVRIWQAAPSRELFTFTGHTQNVYGGQFSPDGTRLSTTSNDGTVKVWNVLNGQLLYTLSLPTGDAIKGGAFSPDGKFIATGAGPGDRLIRIWDAATGELLRIFSGHTAGVFEVKFSPDGTRLASAGSMEKTIRLWDVATGRELFTLFGHEGRVFWVNFSPDGKRLISGGEDKVAIVWDLATRQPLLKLPIPTGVNNAVTFSPDGARLLTTDSTKVAKVWDAATGELLMELSGHTGAVYGAAWSPDGTLIATASADKTAKLWDAATGEVLLTLYGHSAVVGGAAFSPDGTRLATFSDDGAIRIYLLKVEDLIALAEQRVTRSLTTAECQKYLHVEQCPPEP